MNALRRKAILTELAALGLSQKQVAAILRLAAPTISQMAKKMGVKFEHGLKRKEPDCRAAEMADLYRAGRTLQQIGTQYGLTRERVRQLMAKYHGVTARDGGKSVQLKRAAEIRQRKRDQKAWAKHGCSYGEYRALTEMKKPTRAYASQKRNAAVRGIPWEMNLWQWWTIWQQSGKWDERGRRGDAYVMCRKDDQGPYSPENVYIATLRHNSSVQPNNPYRKDHPDHAKLVPIISARLRKALTGKDGVRGKPSHKKRDKDLPCGVSRSPSGKFRANAWADGRNNYLGMFKTPEDAHAAYLMAIGQKVSTAHTKNFGN